MAYVSLHEYQFFLSSIYQGLPSSFDAFLNKYETSGTRLNMFANGGMPLEIAIRSGNTVMLRKLFVHSSPHFQNLGAEPCVDDGDEVAGDDDEENDEEVDVESLHCSMKRRDMFLIFRRVVNDWDQYIDARDDMRDVVKTIADAIVPKKNVVRNEASSSARGISPASVTSSSLPDS